MTNSLFRFYDVCEALGLVDYPEGQAPQYADGSAVLREIKRLQLQARIFEDLRTPRKKDAWEEDFGAVLWWKFPIVEPPYVGTPLDDNFPSYVTHWTHIPLPLGAMKYET